MQGFFAMNVTDGIVADVLPHMEDVIGNRPSSFTDITSCIRYGVMSKLVKNARSACVSMPALVKEDASKGFVWRTDLSATIPFWDKWFENFN